ncbi:hypothetical protein ACRHK7_06675 [Weissella tructae]|uniref:hypothetical protein n=1 Tax=Weissella tructae TaxID=887702 RepID=UPI003D8BA3F2
MKFVLDHIANFRLYHMSLGMTDFALIPAFALADMFWGLDTVLYTVCDKLIDVLFNPVQMNDTIKWVAEISQSLFTGLTGTLFLTAFTLSALIAILYFFTKGRTASIKQILLTLGLVAGSVVWFQFAPTITTSLNTVSTEIGATVATSVSSNLSNKKGAGQIGLVAGTEVDSAKASDQVRKAYFNQSYYALWRLGTVGVPDAKREMIKDFIAKKPLEDKDIDKLKGEKYEHLKPQLPYFDKSSGPFKFIVSVVGLVIIPLKAIPYIFIGLFNWVISMLIMALIIFLPVLAMISFFPNYNKSMLKGISRIVTYFVAKGLVVLSIVVVLIADEIVSKMLGKGVAVGYAGIAGLIVGTVLQFVLLYLVWKYKNKILSVMSGGLVTNVPFADAALSDFNRRMGNVIDGFDEKHVDDPYKKGDGTEPNYYDLKKLEAMDSQDDIQDKDIENYGRLDDEPDNGDEEEIDTSDNDEDTPNDDEDVDDPEEDEDIDTSDDDDMEIPEEDDDTDVPDDEEDEDVELPEEDEDVDLPEEDEDVDLPEEDEDIDVPEENETIEREDLDMPNNEDELPTDTETHAPQDVEQPVDNVDHTPVEDDSMPVEQTDSETSPVQETTVSSDVEYDSSNTDNTHSNNPEHIEQSALDSSAHTNDEA